MFYDCDDISRKKNALASSVCAQVISKNVSCAKTLPQRDCVSQTLKE